MNKLLIRCVLSFSLPVLLVLAACSDTPPEIVQSFTQANMVRHPDTNEIIYQYSVFLHLEDEDGIDDIESIFLIHDDEELFWELNGENWVTVTDEGETWIGSNSITFPRIEPPATGTFRIVVIDAAGDRTTEEAYFQTPPAGANVSFPRLETADDGTLLIRSTYPQHTLWYYDAAGSVIDSYKTEERRVTPSRSPDEIEEMYLYTYSNEHGCGVVSGPYPYPDQ